MMAVLQKYTLLTIGEGLVSQIPALLISTATGLIVTRASSDKPMGQDFVVAVVPQAPPAHDCHRPADAVAGTAGLSQNADFR